MRIIHKPKTIQPNRVLNQEGQASDPFFLQSIRQGFLNEKSVFWVPEQILFNLAHITNIVLSRCGRTFMS